MRREQCFFDVSLHHVILPVSRRLPAVDNLAHPDVEFNLGSGSLLLSNLIDVEECYTW